MEHAPYISQVQFENRIHPASYLNDLPIVQHLSAMNTLYFSAPVTFFVGENGTGKSTLLEAIAVAFGFNAEGGSKNFTFSTRATHSELYKCLRIGKHAFAKDGFFLRAESLYNVASNIDELDNAPSFDPPIIGGYGGVSLHAQSHGESFLSIVQHRFHGHGLYLLDEPEAALSPSRLLTLMVEMNELVKKQSQFIIATHSPLLMAFPGADIWQFSSDGIRPVAYEDTEHVQITKCFLDNPERMFRYLFHDSSTTE